MTLFEIIAKDAAKEKQEDVADIEIVAGPHNYHHGYRNGYNHGLYNGEIDYARHLMKTVEMIKFSEGE